MTSTPRSRSLGAGNIVDEKSAVEKEFLPETFDRLSTKDRKSDGGVEEDGHGGVERGVQEMEKEEVEVEHPNGGYGWVCVGCIFMVNAHTWGLNSSYGIFLAHYLSTNTYPGTTPLSYAFVGGLSISQALMLSPLATITTRIYGTRTTLLIGVFLQTLSLIGASFATRIWHLFLSQGLCFGWGMGFLFVGTVGIVPQWFTTKRSFANGITVAGSGLGGLVYSLASQAMIKNISLGWAFRILGIVSCVVNGVAAVLIKDRNAAIGSSQLGFDTRLFRRREFNLLLAFGVLSMLGYIVLLFSLPSYARSVGLTAKQGSIIGALLNLGQALGRPPVGYFSDAVGRINMAAIATSLAGLFIVVIWVFAESFGVLVFFAILVGTVAGVYWTVVGPVSTEVVGIVELPAALSITWVVLVLPTTFSEAIALEIVSFNGEKYIGAQLFAGFMYIGAAGFIWLVRAWKIGELEELAAEKGVVGEKMDPLAVAGTDMKGGGARGRKSSLWRRMVKWQKV